MNAIRFRDEKLYKVTIENYGDWFHRAIGFVLYSIVKGVGIAFGILFIFLSPKLLGSPWGWYALFPSLAIVCAIWAGFADRSVYVCEIEIFPDRIIRHSGEKTLGIGRDEVRSINERGCWTLFGWVRGLSIRSKEAWIFIPAASPEYSEIKSKLGGWRPVAP
jgi:hypothetical protein